MRNLLLGCFCFAVGAVLGMIIYSWQYRNPEKLIVPIVEDSVSPPPLSAFSLERAPRESLGGMILDINGDVWWQSRVATEAAKLTDKIALQQGETLIASDSGKVTAGFSGILTVTLFPKTKVDIIQTLPVNLVFNQNTGQATYETNGTSPVSVRSLRLLTTVFDGLLQLTVDEKTHVINVTMKNGRAKLAYNNPDLESRIVELITGETFIFESDERSGNLL